MISRSKIAAATALVAVVGAAGMTTLAATNTQTEESVTVTPCRLIDTRTSERLEAAVSQTFDGRDAQCGIDESAVALDVTFTVIGPDESGFLTAWPAAETQPTASSLNWESSTSALANTSVIKLDDTGEFSVVSPRSDIDLVVDIVGYRVPSASGSGGQGAAGAAGVAGPQGEVGPAGVAGVAGVAGPQGEVGPAGVAGVAGVAGPQGEVGPAGADGVAGVGGPQGTTGPAGADGPAGPVGPASNLAPFNLRLDIGESATIGTAGSLSLVAECNDVSGNPGIRILGATSADDDVVMGSYNSSETYDGTPFLLSATAADARVMFSYVSGPATNVTWEIDQGSLMNASGDYLAIDGETMLYGVNYDGTDCVATGSYTFQNAPI